LCVIFVIKLILSKNNERRSYYILITKITMITKSLVFTSCLILATVSIPYPSFSPLYKNELSGKEIFGTTEKIIIESSEQGDIITRDDSETIEDNYDSTELTYDNYENNEKYPVYISTPSDTEYSSSEVELLEPFFEYSGIITQIEDAQVVKESDNITYDIYSQDDFNNLISGATDSENWDSQIYKGTKNLILNINCDIDMSTYSSISSSSNTSLLINGNNFCVSGGTEVIFADFNSIKISDIQVNNTTVKLKNSDIARIENIVFNSSKLNTIDIELLTVYGSSISSADIFDISGNITFDTCSFSNADNFITMKSAGSVCKFNSCTINPSGTAGFVCNNNASVGYEFDSCTGSFEAETGGLINTSTACSYITITNSDFTKCGNILQKQSGTICSGDITISNSDFTECVGTFLNMSQSATGSTDHIISNSTFSLDESVVNTGTYGFIINYIGGLEFTDVTISGFETAIDHQYSGGKCVLTRVTVNGAKYGLNKTVTTPTDIRNCTFSGDGSDGSKGVLVSGAGYNESTGEAEVQMLNSCVTGFDWAVDCKGYTFLVKNSEIKECNKGLFASNQSGMFYIIDSTVTAKENASSDSFGIYSGMGGVHCADTVITGFNTGVGNISPQGNYSGQLSLVGCELDNKDTNVLAYGGYIYNCKLVGATYGVKSKSHVNIFDSYIEGKGNTEGIGISEHDNTSVINLSSYGKVKQPPYNSNTSFDLVRSWSDKEIMYEGVTVNNFKSGIEYTTSPTLYMYYANIHSCDTGINNNNSIYVNASNVYNCSTGMKTISLYPEVNGITVYNCSLAITDENKAGNISVSTSDTPHIVIHDCDKGIEWSGNMTTPYIKIYNVSGDGVTLNGASKTARIALNCYDNGGKNIVNNGSILYLYGTGSSLKSEDGSNVYLEGEMYIEHKDLISDDAVYYLSPGAIIKYTPDDLNLDGVMNFDFEDNDYTEGREIMYGYYDALSDGCIKNKFLTNKEGWIVDTKSITPVRVGACDTALVLTEGCIVTYDYAENGGNSVNTSEKQQYKKDSSIDLTPVATKTGYEFIGWNTDKDATVGLTSLNAGTSNITLYAIYKKDVTITYHTYDDTLTYDDVVTFYNKQSSKTMTLLEYDSEQYPLYNFSGYVLDDSAIISDEDGLYAPKTSVNILITQTDVYCVYKFEGTLTYKDRNGEQIKAVNDSYYRVSSDIEDLIYSYVLENKTTDTGYEFIAWKDSDGNIYKPGTDYNTLKNADVLTAVENPILVKSIEVTPEVAEINIGEDIQLSVSVLPDDALNKSVIWYSENTSIATVDENGLVKGVKEGTVKIYAKTTDGSELSDFSTITVIKQEEPEEPETPEEPEEPEEPQSPPSDVVPPSDTPSNTPVDTPDSPVTGDNGVPVKALGLCSLTGLLMLYLKKRKIV